MNYKLSIIGLAKRANKLLIGENCLENISKVKYLFIAYDASEKTKERYLKKCHYYNINFDLEFDSNCLSNAIGMHNIKIIGIIDNGFKELLIKK